MSRPVVLCFGGRAFNDHAVVAQFLRAFEGMLFAETGDANFAVLHGDAKGADKACGSWARDAGKCVLTVPAPWEVYGVKAGPVRNQWMLEYGRPTHAIGFPGHSGTRDMAQRVRAAGIWLWCPLG